MKYTKYMKYSIDNCCSKLDPGGCVYEHGTAPGTGCGDVRGQLMPLRIMLLTVLAFSTYNPEHNHTQRYAQPRSLLQSGVWTWERAFIIRNIPLTRGKRTLHVLHLFVKNIIKWTPHAINTMYVSKGEYLGCLQSRAKQDQTVIGQKWQELCGQQG